jgi:hypothetical protein
LDGLDARRRISFHVLLAINFVPRVQEHCVVAPPNQLFDLLGAKTVFSNIAQAQIKPALFHVGAGVPAGGTRGLLKKFDASPIFGPIILRSWRF